MGVIFEKNEDERLYYHINIDGNVQQHILEILANHMLG